MADLPTPQSVRLDPALVTALQATATEHGLTVSDLLRIGAEHVAHMSEADLRHALACPTCRGTGQRFKTTRQPEETT